MTVFALLSVISAFESLRPICVDVCASDVVFLVRKLWKSYSGRHAGRANHHVEPNGGQGVSGVLGPKRTIFSAEAQGLSGMSTPVL